MSCKCLGSSGNRCTVNYLIAADSNFDANIYISYSTDGGNTWNGGDTSGTIDDSSRSTNVTFTPPTAGNYLVRITTGDFNWIMPAPIAFTATASAQPNAIVQPPSQSPSSTQTVVGMAALTADSLGGSQTTTTNSDDTTQDSTESSANAASSSPAASQPAANSLVTTLGLPGVTAKRSLLKTIQAKLSGTKGA